MVPASYLTLVVGRPKAGKSLLIMHWLAEATARGERVLYVTVEDGHGEVVRPRLEAAGGAPRHLFVNEAMRRWEATPAGWRALGEAIASQSVGVAVVDTITSALPAGADMNDNGKMAAMLDPGRTVARDLGVALILGCHAPKGVPRTPEEAAMGATSFSTVSRSIIYVGRNRNDGGRWYSTAGNLAESRSRRFTIEARDGVPVAVMGAHATEAETFGQAAALDSARSADERRQVEDEHADARDVRVARSR